MHSGHLKAQVVAAHEAKSFDYRVLHLLLHKLEGTDCVMCTVSDETMPVWSEWRGA